jgi:hypothetical protein
MISYWFVTGSYATGVTCVVRGAAYLSVANFAFDGQWNCELPSFWSRRFVPKRNNWKYHCSCGIATFLVLKHKFVLRAILGFSLA